MKTPTALKTCFISAPFGTDTSALTRELKKRHYRPVDGRSLTTDSPLLEALRASIGSADRSCAVLPSRSAPNALFELGLAVGLGKPIAVFAEAGSYLPSDLAGVTYCRADLQDGPAIGRFLDAFLEHARKSTRPSHRSIRSAVQRLPRPAFRHAQAELKISSDSQLEDLVRRLFEQAGYVVSAPQTADRRSADFAVWIDGLQYAFGNPILVEVKGRIPSYPRLTDIEDQLRGHLERTGYRLALLIYRSGPADEPP